MELLPPLSDIHSGEGLLCMMML